MHKTQGLRTRGDHRPDMLEAVLCRCFWASVNHLLAGNIFIQAGLRALLLTPGTAGVGFSSSRRGIRRAEAFWSWAITATMILEYQWRRTYGSHGGGKLHI